MGRHAARCEDPVARALAYPYPRADHCVRFDPSEGSHGPVRLAGAAEAGRRMLPGHRLPVRLFEIDIDDTRLAERVAVVASGSNASVAQLVRKWTGLADAEPIIIVPARLAGFVSVYSAHITQYGAVPSTLHPAPGAVGHTHLVFMPAAAMPHLDASESLGVNYVLAELAGLAAETDAGAVPSPLAYVSLRGALIDGEGPVALAACGCEGFKGIVRGEPAMLARVQEIMAFDGLLGAFVTRLVEDDAYRGEVTRQLALRAKRWEIGAGQLVAGLG